VDIGLGELRLARLPDRPDGITLGDRRACRDGERAQVRERHGVSVGGRDREALARGGHGACKGHRSGRRRNDDRAGLGTEIDPAMLSRGVRVARVEDERLQDRAVGGPTPGSADRCENERGREDREEDSTSGRLLHVLTPWSELPPD
jgi:hypothetical protein